MHEDVYWLGFSAFPGIGPQRFRKLLEVFGTAKDAWNASDNDLLTVAGTAVTKKFKEFKNNFFLKIMRKNFLIK